MNKASKFIPITSGPASRRSKSWVPLQELVARAIVAGETFKIDAIVAAKAEKKAGLIELHDTPEMENVASMKAPLTGGVWDS